MFEVQDAKSTSRWCRSKWDFANFSWDFYPSTLFRLFNYDVNNRCCYPGQHNKNRKTTEAIKFEEDLLGRNNKRRIWIGKEI